MKDDLFLIHHSAFCIHHSCGLPLRRFSIDNSLAPSRENFMATQTIERTTADATREIISYDPATGAEVGRAPVASNAEVARAVGVRVRRKARGARFPFENAGASSCVCVSLCSRSWKRSRRSSRARRASLWRKRL